MVSPAMLKEQAQHDSQDVHIAYQISQRDLLFAADENTGMSPVQNSLDHGIDRYIHNPLTAENRADQWDDQISGVGILDRGLFHNVQMKNSCRQGPQQNTETIHHQRGQQGEPYHSAVFRRAFHLETRNAHAGDDDIQQQHGQYPAVL